MMSYSWIVALLLLALIAWFFLANRRLQQQLRRQKRHELDLQRELATVVGELSDFKTRRKRLLAASTQALIIVEEDYFVSSANKVAKRLFGSLNKNSQTFIEWTRQHELLELVDLVLSGQKAPPLYFSLNEKILEAHARSIKGKEKVTAVALAIHDVTELQRLSRARRDFVANISHELRTPLASLRLLLDTLLHHGVLDDRPKTLEIIDKMRPQLEILNQLGEEMLDLSLIESGQMPLRFATCPLHTIVEAQITRLQPQIERKNLTVDLRIEDDIQVLVDERMIGRVVSNLVHNAIKFTDKGCIAISATRSNGNEAGGSSADDGEAWAIVAVSDPGTGIPMDDLPRVFERFYKVDPARKQSGTGMGLAIAKHIIEAHGGTIWAKNNDGPGATFYFKVPVED
ncbi:MAG: HAMP domain-containing sensor histidine kinase [Anaerolineae bacterium]|nr:HAMP domain-containing sensor histidine kinase [Anaerolineae bacterium]